MPPHAPRHRCACIRVHGFDGDAVSGLLNQDEHAFLVNMLALVHARSATNVRPRLPLEESYRRHESHDLKDRQAKMELARINRELERLKTEVAVLEERKSKLLPDRGR